MVSRALSEFRDEELFLRLQRREVKAFEEIYNRYWALLLMHAIRILKDEEEAKDVLQEVFSKLWEKAEDLSVNSLNAYLYSSMRNKIFDQIAKSKSRNRYLESLQDFMDKDSYETDALVRERQLTKSIEAEIELLPKKMREVFLLSRTEELSYREISERVNISENTVKKQVSNALKILRLKLSGVVSLFL